MRISLPMPRKPPPVTSANKPVAFGRRVRSLVQHVPIEFYWSSLTGLLAFLVYLATLAPDITWSNYSSDGGELITAAVTLGIPHPPGYPTYVLLGKLISFLPVGTIAFRFNLFSAVCMATAVAFSTTTAYQLVAGHKHDSTAAVAAGLALAWSPLTWSQATVAEVYALNLAVNAVFLWSLLTRRSAWLSGTMLGLAITTHLTSLLMVPLGVALTTKGHRKRLILGLFIGLLPLAALPLLARLGSPVIWGTPANPRGWWWLVTGQLYAGNLSMPDSLSAFLLELSTWSLSALAQFAWIGWPFIALGVLTNAMPQRQSRWLLLSAAFFACFSIAYAADDTLINLLPAFLLLFPFLASGLTRVGYLSLLLPLVLLVANFDSQNLRNQKALRPSVNRMLEMVPQDAVVITPGDASIFSLWYFQHVEGKRPDIILVDRNLLAFDWYRERLSNKYPDLEGLAIDDPPLFRKLNQRQRPICEVTLPQLEAMFCESMSSSISKPPVRVPG